MNSRIRREALERIVGEGDRNCIWELRMNTNAFANLCELLEVQGGLNEDGHATPVEEDYLDSTWRRFKGCLGALDGTYIEVTVPESEKAKYRTRKGKICTNVLGVCNREMGFIYVLSGWEGSASDSQVLRDAITRRNSLKIPHAFLLYSSSHTQGSFHGKLYVGCHHCQWLLSILSVKMVQMLCHSTANHLLVLDHIGIESIDSFASVTTPNNREFESRHSHSILESYSKYHRQGLDFSDSHECRHQF
ncbi:hypothetical protein AHAS_Ahas05G0141100 [Arachis hypogaea]